ncbi:OmpA/MotB domain protein [Shewanella halifaxensis HAW-EB4]|uniref:OmpA/MotB domain protein n=2 Tax=Shewanella halifaxensis TaxID=271098 RepID=B0TJW6_SHEHH|nr:OmpA/MotB domain protein [Shewanella halifaxensis HAW-EB4]
MTKLTLVLIITILLSAALGAQPWQDSDLDGVPDLKDACAATPPNTVVDANGCEKALANERGLTPSIAITPDLCLRTNGGKRYPAVCTKLSSIAVKFEFARADVLLSQAQTLEVIARWLKSTGGDLLLVGHTDSVGSPAYNLQLSFERAEQVKNVLVEQFGLLASRFQVVGVGSAEPIADNRTRQGREQNRRVEFLVIVQ